MQGGWLQNIQAKLLDSCINVKLLVARDSLLIARYVYINRINLDYLEVLGQCIEELF